MPNLTYPETPRDPVVETLHGIEIADPYRWLEDVESAQVADWITAQNALTFNYLDRLPTRDSIAQRLTELWDYEKFGLPIKRGDRYFFTRNDGLQNQSVLYWAATPADEPRLLLDPNTLSDDGTVALSGYAVSRDGKLLAYGLSSAGSDWQEWRVKEIEETGIEHTDLVQWVKFSEVSWTKESAGFFYSRYDEPQAAEAFKEANYYHKLYYHRLGTPQSEDRLIYERPDRKEWGFGGKVSDDGQYLIISVWRGTDPENGVFYQDLRGEQTVVELLNDFDATYHFIGNDGPHFYFHTDLDAPQYRLIAINIRQPDRANWREIIPPTDDTLEAVNMVGDYYIAHYLHHAHSRVEIFDLNGSRVRTVDLPGLGSVMGFGGRRDDAETFFAFTSFTTPDTIYRYDVVTGESTIFRRPAVKFDPADYVTEQVFYPSRDGTRIPMFISYKKRAGSLPRDGSTPTYLYGYGGFNISLAPAFSVSILAWMEMGGIFAQPNLRGGGEYGKPWHDAGKILNKQNVFDDFIAAAEWLIAQGYTQTPKLAIGGGSNGGLLVGACLTQRPDLFGGCLAAVGVLDMLRFHKFTIGWAWTSDYGSPDSATDFEALYTYSPYHNLSPGTNYPPTLITTGDHDDRVFPAHSFKFAAALQHAQAGPAPTLIRVETRAGHGAGKPTAKLIAEAADRWAFLSHILGVEI